MSLTACQKVTEWLLDPVLSNSNGAKVFKDLNVINDPEMGRCIKTSEDIPKGTEIIKIPNQYLLNYLTVLKHLSVWNQGLDSFLKKNIQNFDKKKIYGLVPPNDKITDIYQKFDTELILSMSSHEILMLFICMEKKRGEDSFWKSLLDCFPQLEEYYGIPMTWSQSDSATEDKTLLNLLPRITRLHAESQERQFHSNMKKCESLLVSISDIKITEDEYLWAWLAINTRCLYYKLPNFISVNKSTSTASNNITMVPFVDYVNHRTKDHNCEAVQVVGGYTVKTSSDIKKDEHLWFTYGPHDDDFLQCEYGFHTTDVVQQNNRTSEHKTINHYNYVDLSPVIIKLLESPKNKYICKWLQNKFYYGDYTLGVEITENESSDDEKIISKPSHRTRIALACLMEKNSDFIYDDVKDEVQGPRNLNAFFNGANDGEYYLKSEKALLTKITNKLLTDIQSKLACLPESKNKKQMIVEQMLLNQQYILESYVK